MKTLEASRHILVTLRGVEKNIVLDAIELSASTSEDRAGTGGEPALEVVHLNPSALHVKAHAGTSQWWNALMRRVDVVHSSHADWIDGKVGACYDTIREPSEISIAQEEAIDNQYQVETKDYADGTSATGMAPLPEQSPAELEAAQEAETAAA